MVATLNTGGLMTGTRHTTDTGDQGFRKTKAAHEGQGAITLQFVKEHAPAKLPPRRTLKAQRLFDLFTENGTQKALV